MTNKWNNICSYTERPVIHVQREYVVCRELGMRSPLGRIHSSCNLLLYVFQTKNNRFSLPLFSEYLSFSPAYFSSIRLLGDLPPKSFFSLSPLTITSLDIIRHPRDMIINCKKNYRMLSLFKELQNLIQISPFLSRDYCR